MVRTIGDAKMDDLLAKHAEEIERLESLANAKAKQNDELIAKFHESRAKRGGVGGAR
jgi:hypothetical protein